jgi:hypothetical protein
MTVKTAKCKWCEREIGWNSRKQCWESKGFEAFCKSKLYFPFIHQANEDTIAFTADMLPVGDK